MKLFALTIFALVATGLASPVKNLNGDVLIEAFSNNQENFLISVNEIDEESKKLATFFTETIPKLEKIRDGLKADGKEKASMIVGKAIELYRPFVDENVVAEKKNLAKLHAIGAIAIMHLNKKYLEEEDKSEEALLDGLNLIENNEEAQLVSVFADVDEESKQLAAFFEKTMPKLEKIRDGLKKDGKERASKALDKLMGYYKTLTNPEKVAENKQRARVSAFIVVVIMHSGRKYLEEDNKEAMMEAMNFIKSEDNELEVVSLDAEVDEESKKLAEFFVKSIPMLEKVRDGLKADGKEKASMVVAKVTELYRPYTSAEHVAANKNKAKWYALVTVTILHFNQKYLEQ